MHKANKVIKVNLWDYYDKVNLAAQRMAFIERALHFREPRDEQSLFDDIMQLADNKDGEFILTNFDGFNYSESVRIRVQFEYDDERKKVVPEILFHLA
jgi:hypothetical protein